MTPERFNDVWDAVAFHGSRGEVFKPRQVIASLIARGWNAKSAELYWNQFKNWAFQHPEEFEGPKSKLQKVIGGYRLGDS
jgi:hypothetical protein